MLQVSYVGLLGTPIHTISSLVPRPNFFAYPVALSKNRVWTLSLGKLEPVDIQWSVIVGVHYQLLVVYLSFGAQRSASWLSVVTY